MATGAWYRFYNGAGWKISKRGTELPKPIIAGPWGLFYPSFPDGKKIATLDLSERRLVVEDSRIKSFRKEVHFDYTTEGANIMSLAAGPDGTINGGTTFPMRAFSYSPETGKSVNRESYGQWNTMAVQGNKFFVGGYGAGFL